MKALGQKPAIYLPAFNLANYQHSVLQRDTMYTPPRDCKWIKPLSLYGYVPKDLREKLSAAYHDLKSHNHQSDLDSNSLTSLPLSSPLPMIAVVKRKVEEIFDRLSHDDTMGPFERKIMTNGLSSIADFSDKGILSQQALFSADE
ncbi:predicted protein [Lichtheimia corymbifera JMRC:FSU:9682]|uniref:Uncharacterized protein n=1 Tax=Lichtheimia corymbifera JMRC:FSU:9682 TaxID=1263082 RepID=A0A068RWP3_9FUNG|nr:predicted protein [Lichtheimia corymbifera JMRC:FSU:9682]